jgi:hypothetical protein
VKALDEQGQSVELDGSGLLARVFCHEIDHLDGILFIDKVIPGSIVNQKALLLIFPTVSPVSCLHRAAVLTAFIAITGS